MRFKDFRVQGLREFRRLSGTGLRWGGGGLQRPGIQDRSFEEGDGRKLRSLLVSLF